MAKKYVVKWYDWHAGHYKEKECNSEQLNELCLKLKRKKEISDIKITEVTPLNYTNDFKQQYCPICKVYQIFKKDTNNYRCMKCRKYILTIQKD